MNAARVGARIDSALFTRLTGRFVHRREARPATPVKPKEEPVDESKLFAAKKKKKVGVPLEKIMATVTGEGCNHATLVAIARAIGAPIPEASSVKQAPQSTTKTSTGTGYLHLRSSGGKEACGVDLEDEKRTLGAARSRFTENQAASEMLEEMFALPAPKKAAQSKGEEVQLLKARLNRDHPANLRDVKPWLPTEDESSPTPSFLNDCRNYVRTRPD